MGFYSVCPGTDQYVLGSPVFQKTTISLENGNQFVIDAQNNSKNNVYINEAKLNNSNFTKNFLTYKEISNGGTFTLDMTDKPNKNRGKKESDQPFSLTE